jgi:hypothetical protein
VDSEFKTELSSMTYHLIGDQREIERKEGDPEANERRRKPLKSPDLGDSAALTHAHPVKPKQREEFWEHGMPERAKGGGVSEWTPAWQK